MNRRNPDLGLEVLLQAPSGNEDTWVRIRRPTAVLEAYSLDEVQTVLEQVESASREGLWAAGFLCYEAAPAFDSAFEVAGNAGETGAGALPLAWFVLSEGLDAVPPPGPSQRSRFKLSAWQPSVSEEEHAKGVERILDRIARGDTYQVNYTLRLEAEFSGDPFELFTQMSRGEGARGCAFIATPRWAICSASPELFFRRTGDRLVSRPMKGTIERGLTLEADRKRALELAASDKDRAENLMIVDMVRNDLGRVAEPGSVQVTRLFDVEKYDTLHQLTSTVEARTSASLPEIFTALFPSASITGAPKVSAMRRIARLEGRPRGVYTGAIGLVGPGQKARFNVAIRTAQIDLESGRAIYGTGGGIVWDSNASDEYRECQAKTLVLSRRRPEFSLLESLRWEPEDGYHLLERHLARLEASAEYFDFPMSSEEVLKQLATLASRLPRAAHKVRLLLDATGKVQLSARPLGPKPQPWKVAFATKPISRTNRFLYHKTTHREVYDRAREALPHLDDVLLWNEEGEITESTMANVVARVDGELVTPEVTSGLLAGTLRAELLEEGALGTRVLHRDDLVAAEELYLINSVRGWIKAILEDPDPSC